MTNLDNARAVRGDNRAPESAQQVAEQLERDYKGLSDATSSLLDRARDLPDEVLDESDLNNFSTLIVNLHDKSKEADSIRVQEKEPYLRGGQAVDGFFKAVVDKLDKTATILLRRVNAYNQKKLAEERRIREEQRVAAERVARETAAREAAERAAAEAAEAAARRMRKPENIEAQQEIADKHRQEEADAKIESDLAAQAAEDARIAQLQKPAELVRTRFDEGRVVTMRQEGYAEVVDRDALDKEALWAHLKDDHIALALRSWAKVSSYKKPMDGASIGLRDKTVIR